MNARFYGTSRVRMRLCGSKMFFNFETISMSEKSHKARASRDVREPTYTRPYCKYVTGSLWILRIYICWSRIFFSFNNNIIYWTLYEKCTLRVKYYRYICTLTNRSPLPFTIFFLVRTNDTFKFIPVLAKV